MLGTRIKNLRIERDWSQMDLAKRLGVARTTICEYERNTITPPYDKLLIMADTFGVSVKYLTGESFSKNDDNSYDITDISEQLNSMLDKLSDKNNVIKFKGKVIHESTKLIMRDHLLQGIRIIDALEQT